MCLLSSGEGSYGRKIEKVPGLEEYNVLEGTLWWYYLSHKQRFLFLIVMDAFYVARSLITCTRAGFIPIKKDGFGLYT